MASTSAAPDLRLLPDGVEGVILVCFDLCELASIAHVSTWFQKWVLQFLAQPHQVIALPQRALRSVYPSREDNPWFERNATSMDICRMKLRNRVERFVARSCSGFSMLRVIPNSTFYPLRDLPPDIASLTLPSPAPSMTHVAALSANAVRSLPAANPCLTSLAIAFASETPMLSSVGAGHFPHLRQLHMMLDHRADSFDGVFVACDFFAHLPELAHLEVSGLSLYEEAVEHFALLTKLERLRVLHVAVALFDYDELLKVLPADLKELQMPPDFEIKSTSLDHLSRFHCLKYLTGFALGPKCHSRDLLNRLPSLENLVSLTTTGPNRSPRLVQEALSFADDLQRLYLPNLKRVVLHIEEEWHEILTGLHGVAPNLEALKLVLRTDLFDSSWEACERVGLRLPEFGAARMLALEFSCEMYADAKVSKLLHLVARSFPNIVEFHMDSADHPDEISCYRKMDVAPLSLLKALRFVDIGESVVGRSGLFEILSHLSPTVMSISCVIPRSMGAWERFVKRKGASLAALMPKQSAIFVRSGCFVNGEFQPDVIRDTRMDPFLCTFIRRKGLSVRRDISPAENPELP